MVYCTSCGQQLMASMRICPSCGGQSFSDAAPARMGGRSTASSAAFAPAGYTSSGGSGGASSSARVAWGVATAYAGFWRRFAANLIDGLILLIVTFVLFFVFLVLMGAILGSAGVNLGDDQLDQLGNSPFSRLLFYSLFLIVAWLYYAFQESSRRQATLGKRAIGIRVTDLAGNRISFGRATGRYFARYLSSMFFGIGFIMAGLTRRKQALHDKIADTLVITA